MFSKDNNGLEVVSISEREKERRLAPIKQVEAYWHGLCDGTDVPLRSQIDPRGMEGALENAFLLEKIAPGMAKFRVAGSHLNDLMGMQVGGMPLSCMIAPAERDRLKEAVAPLFEGPSIIRISLKAEGGFGKPELEADLILMPLRSDFGDLTRAVGAMVSHGRIGRTPRRFTLESVEISPALATPSVPAPAVQDAPKADPVRARTAHPGFGEKVTSFDHQKQGAAKRKPPVQRGHLRLIVDNEN